MVRSPNFDKPKLLSEHVYEQLRAAILANYYAPGEVLVEEKLAAQWSVSRTPLRAALARLEKDGLVSITPHKGCVVVPITPQSVTELFQVREGLEVMAAELATPHIPEEELAKLDDYFNRIEAELEQDRYDEYISSDAQFHELFTRYVPNRLLSSMLSDIHGRVTRIRNFAHAQPGDHMRQAFEEHRAILAALMRREPAAVAETLRHHLRNVARRTLDLMPDVDSSSPESDVLTEPNGEKPNGEAPDGEPERATHQLANRNEVRT